MDGEQRLLFGGVAEDYERYRPGYPPALIDDVLAFAGAGPGSRVLEVGAGTGKATRLLLERGLRLTCIEPDAEMAAVLRRPCPEAEVVLGGFEQFGPVEPLFDVVCSAQAWHWVEPDARRHHTPTLLR